MKVLSIICIVLCLLASVHAVHRRAHSGKTTVSTSARKMQSLAASMTVSSKMAAWLSHPCLDSAAEKLTKAGVPDDITQEFHHAVDAAYWSEWATSTPSKEAEADPIAARKVASLVLEIVGLPEDVCEKDSQDISAEMEKTASMCDALADVVHREFVNNGAGVFNPTDT